MEESEGSVEYTNIYEDKKSQLKKFIIEELDEDLDNYEKLDIPVDVQLFVIYKKDEYQIYTRSQMNKICGYGNWRKKYFCPYKTSTNLFVMNDIDIKYFIGELIERLEDKVQ